MRHARILMVLFCLGVFIPAVHAQSYRPGSPAPATPASDDPLCWRVPLACVSSALRSEERRLYLDITNVCEDKLYMSVCFEIENPIDVEINSSCDQFALRPGGRAEVFAWKMEKPTERYEIKAFGVKDGRYGRYRQCLDLIPGFDDVPFLRQGINAPATLYRRIARAAGRLHADCVAGPPGGGVGAAAEAVAAALPLKLILPAPSTMPEQDYLGYMNGQLAAMCSIVLVLSKFLLTEQERPPKPEMREECMQRSAMLGNRLSSRPRCLPVSCCGATDRRAITHLWARQTRSGPTR